MPPSRGLFSDECPSLRLLLGSDKTCRRPARGCKAKELSKRNGDRKKAMGNSPRPPGCVREWREARGAGGGWGGGGGGQGARASDKHKNQIYELGGYVHQFFVVGKVSARRQGRVLVGGKGSGESKRIFKKNPGGRVHFPSKSKAGLCNCSDKPLQLSRPRSVRMFLRTLCTTQARILSQRHD